MSYKPSMYMGTHEDFINFIKIFGYEEYDRLLSLENDDLWKTR